MTPSELLRLVKPATSAAAGRSNIPILKCVRLGGGRVVGSDLDRWVTVSDDALDLPEVCVDADILVAHLSAMPGDDLRIELDGSRLVLKCGRRRGSLDVMPADEFPEPQEMHEPSIRYERDDLVPALRLCLPAVSIEKPRYYLCGVAIAGSDVVATDGNRLIMTRIAEEAVADPAIIVPALTVKMLPERNLTVSSDRRLIRFEAAGWSMVSRLIDGSFPDYKRAIPHDAPVVAEFQADALADLCASADKLCRRVDSSSGVTGKPMICLSTRGDAVEFASTGGELSDEIDADVAVEFSSGFNPRLLASVLGPSSGRVVWRQSDKVAPAVFKFLDDERITSVCMPMRI